MDFVFADSEVRSRVSVTEVGSYVYAADPGTEPILWSIMPYKAPRALVFEFTDIYEILGRLRDAHQIKWTKRSSPLRILHWSPFDRIVQREVDRRNGIEWPEDDGSVYGVPGPHNTVWVDLSELSLSTGLPIKLERAAAFVGQELKDPGKKLIELFCLPQEGGRSAEPDDFPVQWEQFRQYCAQDVQAMRPIFDALCSADVFMDEHVERSWAARRMNDRGVRVDVKSAAYVLEKLDSAQRSAEGEIFDLYGFKTSQVAKLCEFLGTPNAQVDTIQAALDSGTLDPDQQFVAEARVGMAGAARKKLGPLVRNASPVDHRVRGAFIYCGAWTGRFTSVGVQMQNFVREPIDDSYFAQLHQLESADLFARTRANIRGFIQAAPGYTFVAGDFKAIELRVGAWLAAEAWLLDLLAKGVDVYRAAAAERLQKPLFDVTEEERQFYKSVELGCMYGLGPDGWVRQQGKKGVRYERSAAQMIIGDYRATHPAFVEAWRHVGRRFLQAIHAPAYTTVEAFDGRVEFTRYPQAIVATRPSGASQFYWMPSAVPGHWPDGTEKEDDDIQVAMKNDTGYMAMERTYGARIFQGLVQGIAYDLMIEALVRVEKIRVLPPVMSIHDELVCEVPTSEAESRLGTLRDLMKSSRDWAATIPIEVSTWSSDRFTAK